MDRREFFQSAGATGISAAFVRVLQPSVALARVSSKLAPQIASGVPCPFTVTGLTQDATAVTDGQLQANPFYAPQASGYRIKISWAPAVQTQAGNENAAVFFRLVDSANHYRLNFFPTQVGLLKFQNGIHYEVGRASRTIDPAHPAKFTLSMTGPTFKIQDNAVPGAPTILSWTDPANTFPTGLAVILNTWPFCSGTWTSVKGTPT